MKGINAMRRPIGLIGLLAILIGSCDCNKDSRVPDARLLVITDLQGTIEPCGCTSRPLGGIDRMAELVGDLGNWEGPGGTRQEVPTIFVAAGDLLGGGPAHSGPETPEPDAWRRSLVAEVLRDAGLRLAAPSSEDVDYAELSAPFTSESSFVSDGVGVLIASGHDAAEQVQALRDQGARLVVVLSSRGRREDRDLASVEGVDLLIQGAIDAEVPAPPLQVDGNAFVINAGRQGQRVVAIDLYFGQGVLVDRSAWSVEVARERLEAEIALLGESIERWKAEGQPADRIARKEAELAELEGERDALSVREVQEGERAFVAKVFELDPERAQSSSVRELMIGVDQRINEHNQQAFADRTPPVVEEGQASYVGSASCASCHSAAYEWWQSHPHGIAYSTLEERHKEFHLECVGCHVTGYERPGGSTVTHNLEGALVNVGCENCHGPGSLHIASPTEVVLPRDTPESTCIECHNEEHSDTFVYDIYRRTLVVPGHGLPAP